MSTPIIMVCLIWQFTQIWNDFLFGVVFSSGDSQPITVALNNLVNTSTGAKEYNVDMAAAMIAGRSEEHTSAFQSLMRISYAVFCLIKNTIFTHLEHNHTLTIHFHLLHF